jgi:hypothetical protein
MSRSPHSPWFDLHNNIWGGVQIMTLLIVQFPPFSCYFIPPRPKYSPQNPVLIYPQSQCSSLRVKDQVLHPSNTTVNFNLYIPRQQAGR